MLEVDSNENVLRGAFSLWNERADRSRLRISDEPGLGIVELPEEIDRFLTLSATVTGPGQFTVAVQS